jgi:transposase-like protein
MADDRAQYNEAELKALRASLAAEGPPTCPRCKATMNRRTLGGGSFGLGYARHRDWLICPVCRRSAIFDVKRGTRN